MIYNYNLQTIGFISYIEMTLCKELIIQTKTCPILLVEGTLDWYDQSNNSKDIVWPYIFRAHNQLKLMTVCYTTTDVKSA